MSYGHMLERTATGGQRCSRCLRTLGQINHSRRRCPGVPWYAVGSAPDNLCTRLQLKERGLCPGKDQPHVGIIVTAFGDPVRLYDIALARPRRGETEKQRAARLATWEKTREKWKCEDCGAVPASIGALSNYWRRPGLCEDCLELRKLRAQEERLQRKIERDRREVCVWAADLLAHPETWCVIDTETTSLTGVIVELAIVDAAGTVLFESLVNPDGVKVSSTARAIHGLSDEELAAAPILPEIWPRIAEALAGRSVLVAYNAAFDQARLEQSAARYELPALVQKWECAMVAYAAFCGDWSDYHGNYRWIPLDGGHRAADDARAALARLREMAAEQQLKEMETRT